jgi:hypothetical protein
MIVNEWVILKGHFLCDMFIESYKKCLVSDKKRGSRRERNPCGSTSQRKAVFNTLITGAVSLSISVAVHDLCL